MRTLFLLFLFTSGFCASQELEELRTDYPKANKESSFTDALFEILASVSKEDDKTLVGYKGALLTLKAKHAKGFGNKKKYFKAGVELLEFAIESDTKNIEIRCLRLSVQENAPRIVGYKGKIEEDKKFLLNNYAVITDMGVRKFIKGYVQLSEAFSVAEKQSF